MNDNDIRRMLAEAKTIAVVGLSGKPHRASHGVAVYLQRQGYRIIPVHPNEKEVLGERVYRSLSEVPEPIDLVDVFRAPEAVPAVLEEAERLGLKQVWLQEGITHPEAEAKAEAAGLRIVSDRCILKEHRRLLR